METSKTEALLAQAAQAAQAAPIFRQGEGSPVLVCGGERQHDVYIRSILLGLRQHPAML